MGILGVRAQDAWPHPMVLGRLSRCAWGSKRGAGQVEKGRGVPPRFLMERGRMALARVAERSSVERTASAEKGRRKKKGEQEARLTGRPHL